MQPQKAVMGGRRDILNLHSLTTPESLDMRQLREALCANPPPGMYFSNLHSQAPSVQGSITPIYYSAQYRLFTVLRYLRSPQIESLRTHGE
jgi:hypothetical protein